MRPGITPNPVDVIGNLPEVAGAGSCIITDPRGNRTDAFIRTSQTGWYRLDFVNRAIHQLPVPVGSLVFGAGNCAVWDATGPNIYCVGAGTGGGNLSATIRYTVGTGAWTDLDAGNTLSALLGGLWATDGALCHPCRTIAAPLSDDFIYAIGGGDAGLQRYQISIDTWTSPGAPGVVPGAGATFNWPWANSIDLLYALDGGGVATGEQYSIAGNVWGAMAFVPPISAVLPNTGSCSCVSTDGSTIYFRVNATGTIYSWNPVTTAVATVGQIYGPDGVATVGGKMCAYEVGGVEYLVVILHGSSQIQRIRIVK